MNENFPQQLPQPLPMHCFSCHQDYINGTHPTCGSGSAANCAYCISLQQATQNLAPKNYKYCYHCGKEL